MENNDSWISQLLQTAMFELDTLVGRALIDDMAKILPLTLYGAFTPTQMSPAHATALPDPPHELPVLDPLEDSTMNFEDFLGFDFFNHIGVSGL
ncbi:unnamed protein product [Parascedosporium putredinis]|uniref:Uncharacterized protein n=1 Tax=Parascedosporium putredinis TaxID=1442378 RepID=A0A9P1H0E4_9PEZI|nr:unnamed protein product [Parascedosporium putredinis]CAI7992009.1 unnamed protein product [Parascedosporium putredinis]